MMKILVKYILIKILHLTMKLFSHFKRYDKAIKLRDVRDKLLGVDINYMDWNRKNRGK